MKIQLSLFILGLFSCITAYSQPSTSIDASNKVALPSFVDTSNLVKGKEFKILILGNSITLHGVSDKLGWYHESGMAASSKGKDYAHLLFKEMEGLLPHHKLSMRLTNFSDFEKNYARYNAKTVEQLAEYSPDLVIFQLGENVTFSAAQSDSVFQQKYVELIQRFKLNKPIILCTLPFFSSNKTIHAIKQVAFSTQSFVVDLSSFTYLDRENQAGGESNYPLDKRKWKDKGLINMHPGDVGMRNIAETIFITIKAIDNLGMLVKK